MDSTQSLNDILVNSGLAELTRDIKLGKFERSYEVAKRTLLILINIVKTDSWSNAGELIKLLKGVCSHLDGLNLVETAAGNMNRRVMRLIRDECHQLRSAQCRLSPQAYDETLEGRDEFNDSCLDLDSISRKLIIDNILECIEQELSNELELSSKSIAQQAVDYVQSDDIILTLGKSKVIESFLKHAAIGGRTGKRKFNVIVVELAPFYSGREMAKSLNKSGIGTLIIPDSAAFAIMSRVNKVIIGCHSMMANGGIKAPAGSHSIALAAKHFAVPLIVCCPMFKLTPQYLVSHDSQAFKRFSHLHEAFPEPYTPRQRKQCARVAEQGAAGELSELAVGSERNENLPASTGGPTKIEGEGKDLDHSSLLEAEETSSTPATSGPRNKVASATVESLHSTFDYVPPELITLFVSNIGGNSPSYVYQLLNELYCKSDYLI